MLTYFLGIATAIVIAIVARMVNVRMTEYKPNYQWVEVKVPSKQFPDFRDVLDRHEGQEFARIEVPIDVNRVKHPRFLDVIYCALWRYLIR